MNRRLPANCFLTTQVVKRRESIFCMIYFAKYGFRQMPNPTNVAVRLIALSDVFIAMKTWVDLSGSASKNNYVVETMAPLLADEKRSEVESNYREYCSECVGAAIGYDTIDELIKNVDEIQKRYMTAGAMKVLKGQKVDILKKRHVPNEHIKDIIYKSVNNGGLVFMSSDDERTVDSFAQQLKLENYGKICSRLAERDGILTGKFDRIVCAKDKMAAYDGGTVYANGINDIGVIVEALKRGHEVNICDSEQALVNALDNLGLLKRVHLID